MEDDDQSPGPGIATISEHVVVVRRGLETESQPVAAAGLVVPGPEITAADAAGVRETVEVEGGLTALRPSNRDRRNCCSQRRRYRPPRPR